MIGHDHLDHDDKDGIGIQKVCISIVPIFNHLDEYELREIYKTTHSVSYSRGQMIYRTGEPSESLYIVRKGKVKVFRISSNGKEQLVRILKPGDFTGEHALFSVSSHEVFAEALEPVVLCVMGRKDLEEFLLKYPNIAIKMLSEYSRRLANAEKQAANISMETVETRIALYLENQAEEQKNQKITLQMSRKDLASYLGTSPETVSRKLAVFEDAGWIRQINQRELEIINLDALLHM